MTVTKDDFNKIWASKSPLKPYSFSESKYKEGWNFIGSTPPSRQMWDFLQKNNGEKMQYLLNHFGNYLPLSGGTLKGVVNGVTPPNGDNSKKLATTAFVNAKAGNYLPLSGGTMTGELVFGSGTGQGHMGNAGDYFRISATKFSYADNPGAGLDLRGRTATTDAGAFVLEAQSNSDFKTLVGKPDGTLTWNSQPLLPVGVVQAFAGTTIPNGWLLCDGSAVSRTTYAKLFSVIGTTYGSGNGSTTFNLPNLVDKFVEGSATSGAIKSAGLPNITGSFGLRPVDGGLNVTWETNTGAIKVATETGGSSICVSKGSSMDHPMNVIIDASRSSSVYGNSTTVQPPALTMRYIIKY